MTAGDAVLIAVVSGGISFAAGVVAVVVGQLLGGRFQRQADEKRWLREDADRRRVRAEEAAEQILATVDKVSDLLRHGTRRLGPPPDQELLRLAYRSIRKSAARIPDEAVQRLADMAADIIYYYEPEWHFRENQFTVGRVLEEEVRAVMGAYLTDRPIPAAPGIQAMANELEAHDRWLEESIAVDEEAQDQERRGREAAVKQAGDQDEATQADR